MPFSTEEINEFKVEAEELLDSAETSLAAMSNGEPLEKHYDAIFRVFHSLKGAAGMMELSVVQAHMHQVESIFMSCKGSKTFGQDEVQFFLRAIDACRAQLEGQTPKFDYNVKPTAKAAAAPAPATSPAAKAAAPAEAPAKAAEAPAAPEPVRVITPKPAAKESLGKILIVDDEEVLVDVLESLLTLSGFEVKGTSKPEEVISIAATFKPDVLLSDISMPKITGHELLKMVKKAYPDLPVIFLSGQVDKEALLEGIRNGVYSVIEKPFNKLQVVDACMAAIKLHKMTKLFNKSINLILYQFSDLDDYLVSQGKVDVRNSIRYEIEGLLKTVKELKN